MPNLIDPAKANRLALKDANKEMEADRQKYDSEIAELRDKIDEATDRVIDHLMKFGWTNRRPKSIVRIRHPIYASAQVAEYAAWRLIDGWLLTLYGIVKLRKDGSYHFAQPGGIDEAKGILGALDNFPLGD